MLFRSSDKNTSYQKLNEAYFTIEGDDFAVEHMTALLEKMGNRVVRIKAIKCGVELADSEKSCPLCGTVVFNPELSRPDGKPTYPREHDIGQKNVRRTGVLFVITMLFLLPIATVFLCDWTMNSRVVWSGYVIGAVLLFYILAILPLWFHKPNPVIFIPADFAAIALYLLYINLCQSS